MKTETETKAQLKTIVDDRDRKQIKRGDNVANYELAVFTSIYGILYFWLLAYSP